MNEISGVARFHYPRDSILKDYGQSAAGAVIFGAPLILSGGNIYVAVIFGGIVLMFLSFGYSTWRRHHSVIVVTDDGIGVEGARNNGISWQGIESVELRYFSTRKQRGREDRGDEGSGWMQLKLHGEGVKLRIDSTLDGFDAVARRVANAIDRHDIGISPTTKLNFSSMGVAPNAEWAEADRIVQ